MFEVLNRQCIFMIFYIAVIIATVAVWHEKNDINNYTVMRCTLAELRLKADNFN